MAYFQASQLIRTPVLRDDGPKHLVGGFMLKYLLAGALAFSPSVGLAQSILPQFSAVPKRGPGLLLTNPGQVVHETQSDYILKSSLTNFESYDYYYIQLTKNSPENGWFRENLHVVFEKANEYVIVEVRNENQLLAAASLAHSQSGACGMVQKISNHPITMEKQSAERVSLQKQEDVAQLTRDIEIQNILNTMETMVSWGTRFEGNSQGVDTAEKLKELFEQVIPDDREDITIDLIDHVGSDQKSLRIRIEGTTQPEKIVILGSHIDSLNRSDNTDAPGADDNASGTATNLEVLRVILESGFRPNKTIEIHGYGAEEIGLVGSKEMAESYKQQNKQVVSMVQFDMNAFANGEPKITFVSNGTDRSLTSQLQSLARNYSDVPVSTGFLMFGSSDHAAWRSQGFPVAFPTEDPFGFNRKIHSHEDTMANINSPEQIQAFGKLGVAYLMHFSQ